MMVKEEIEKTGLKLNIQKMKFMVPSTYFMANRWGNNGSHERFYFGGAPKSLQTVIAAKKLKMLPPWKKS